MDDGMDEGRDEGLDEGLDEGFVGGTDVEKDNRKDGFSLAPVNIFVVGWIYGSTRSSPGLVAT